MPDQTAAALQAPNKQVKTRTTTVIDQSERMDGLHEYGSHLLDQTEGQRREGVAFLACHVRKSKDSNACA